MDPKENMDLDIDLELDDTEQKDIKAIDPIDQKISSASLEFLDTLISKLNIEVDEDTKVELSTQLSNILRELYTMGAEGVEGAPIPKEDIDSIDAEYKDAMERAISKIEKFYVMCLEKAKSKLEKSKEKSKSKRKKNDEKLVEHLNSFINTFLEENIKKESVIKEEEVKRLKDFYDSIREAVFVHNSDIQDTIQKKVTELDTVVSNLKEKLTKSLKDRILLKEQLQNYEKDSLITETIATLDPRLAKQVKRRLIAESLETIKKEKDEIIKEEQEALDGEIESARGETQKASRKMERITESSTQESSGKSVMDIYAEEAARLQRYG